jgi:hypothetical protein
MLCSDHYNCGAYSFSSSFHEKIFRAKRLVRVWYKILKPAGSLLHQAIFLVGGPGKYP